MRYLAAAALLMLLTGCLPIGIRGTTSLVSPAHAPPPEAARNVA
jgi:hypothetical protein